jgi:hypothetical protein
MPVWGFSAGGRGFRGLRRYFPINAKVSPVQSDFWGWRSVVGASVRSSVQGVTTSCCSPCSLVSVFSGVQGVTTPCCSCSSCLFQRVRSSSVLPVVVSGNVGGWFSFGACSRIPVETESGGRVT